MTAGPLADWLTQRSLAQLKQSRPRLIIFWGQPEPLDHPIVHWAMENYYPLPGEGRRHFPLVFYVRRDAPILAPTTWPSSPKPSTN